MSTDSQRLTKVGSQRLKALDLPPEEILQQLLEKMVEVSDHRFADCPAASARMVSLNKMSKSCILVLRSLLETNEFAVGN